VCRRCGGKIKIVAYIHDTVAIQRILDQVGLTRPEAKPPPQVEMVVRGPLDEEAREISAAPIRRDHDRSLRSFFLNGAPPRA